MVFVKNLAGNQILMCDRDSSRKSYGYPSCYKRSATHSVEINYGYESDELAGKRLKEVNKYGGIAT